jgi:hypothetical protein
MKLQVAQLSSQQLGKRIWSAILIVMGFGLVTGLFDRMFASLVLITNRIDINEYYHPHYDAFTDREPVIGAIFLVGGLILRYMPEKAEKIESGRPS